MTDPTTEKVDARISREHGRRYWEGVDATVDGMLGGFPHVSRVDLRGSHNFLAKLGIGSKPGLRMAARVLEGGAGIGRITRGLLLDGIASEVDVIEPIAKFTAALQDTPGVGRIFTMGLEDWEPPCDDDGKPRSYDLVWIQWCVGHLTDEQLVGFLRRCKTALNPDGLIVVKENNTTSDGDEFDDLDSAVTRHNDTFRRIFDEAGLRVIRVELQKGFGALQRQLLPVRMYALRPAE
ncbi:hypothetical protein VTJ49DRAFT_832 [Mycothermus thermophilus]|uniref:Alpha N-terminal protein methyltransferase 1 n=1 Tax=Humicola insolens TaxID=85995 RepID=A0ABR3VF60_HUMIN